MGRHSTDDGSPVELDGENGPTAADRPQIDDVRLTPDLPPDRQRPPADERSTRTSRPVQAPDLRRRVPGPVQEYGPDYGDDRPAWASAAPLASGPFTDRSTPGDADPSAPGDPVTDLVPVWLTAPAWEGATTSFRSPVQPTGHRGRFVLAAIGAGTLVLALLALIITLLPGGEASPRAAGDRAGPSVDDGQTTVPPGSGATADASQNRTPRSTAVVTSPATTGTTGTTGTSGTTDRAVPPASAGSPSPSARPTPPTTVPGGPISAVYSVQNSWPNGFIGQIVLTNRSTTAQNWQVVIVYPSTVTGYVAGWSNAPTPPNTLATAHSATITAGSPLAAGQSVAVFVQFNRQGDDITPTQCSANGAVCALG